MTIITRFAPSPTGFLHIGNLRTALITWLYTKSKDGKFILRIDDTDSERSKCEYVDALKEDLKWMGLDWDICFHQSDRSDKYEEAKQKLIDSRRLYQCFETEEELALKKKMLLSRNLPPIYDRAALKLTQNEKQLFEKEGRSSYWRFLLSEDDIVWSDKIRGELKFSAKNLSDPVLIRANGTLTYSLASVVDDIEYGITDVVRGEDHISNSAVHIQLFKALCATPPEFAHIALLSSKEKKLSKREGGFDVKQLKKRGILPLSLAIFLAKIGTSESVDAEKKLSDLIKEFSFENLNKATIQYDHENLALFNAKVIHSLNYNEVKKILQDLCIPNIDEDFWLSVRGNVEKIDDIRDWWRICKEDIKTQIVDKELIELAREHMPKEDFDAQTWDTWINNIKKNTEKRGKQLFLPIRLALTGEINGPELKCLLPFIDKSLILKRLLQ
jgi:glutamyl-tRNA synthetase